MALRPEQILRDVQHVHAYAGSAGRPRRATAEECAENVAKLKAWERDFNQRAAEAAGMPLGEWLEKESKPAIEAYFAKLEAEQAAAWAVWDQYAAEKREAEVPEGECPDWLAELEQKAKRREIISRAKQALAKKRYAASSKCRQRRKQHYIENRERLLARRVQQYADKVLARKEQKS